MKDWDNEKLSTLNALLDSWFEQGLQRNGEGKWNRNVQSEDVARFAGQIYKRGLRSLYEESARSRMMVPQVTNARLTPDLYLAKDSIFRHAPLSAFTNFLSELTESWNRNKVFVVMDAGFAKHWEELKTQIEILYPNLLMVSPSEEKKNLDLARTILTLLNGDIQYILAIGGGIVCDVAGFVAGIAGLQVRYLATTLLAAVDAAIGGKTGVNHTRYGKNQLGLFVPISRIAVNTTLFNTLNPQLLVSGMCESIKHSWIAGTLQEDAADYHHFLNNLTSPGSIDFETLVRKSFTTKRKVVEVDPTERGLRQVLNFGHTLGHLLEALAHRGVIDEIPHGIAVGYGLIALGKARLLDFDPQAPLLLEIVSQALAKARCHLPIETNVDLNTLKQEAKALLAMDKKNTCSQTLAISLPQSGIIREALEATNTSFITQRKYEFVEDHLLSTLFRMS